CLPSPSAPFPLLLPSALAPAASLLLPPLASPPSLLPPSTAVPVAAVIAGIGHGAVRPSPPGLLLMSTGEPVTPTMPPPIHTLGAPSISGHAPPVLCETMSFNVPGSLPCDALKALPTVATGAPLTLIREGAPAMPSREVPVVG